MGIPQYGYGDNDGSEGFGDGDSDSGTGTDGAGTGGGGGGGNDDNNDGGFTAAERAAGQAARDAIAAHNAAVKAGLRPGEDRTDYTPQFGLDVATAMAQAEQNRLAQQVARSYIDYAGIMGPSLYSAGNVGGSLLNFLKTGSTGGVPIRSTWFSDPTTLGAFKDIALGQIPGRMAQAKAGYGLPGVAGGLLGGVGSFTLNQMQKALEDGGRPVFDATGQLKGVFSEGPFGFGEVYTGTPVEGVEGTGYDAGGTDGGPEIKPVNPETGQCEDGYIFDAQLNACRLDTGTAAASAPTVTTPTTGGYAQMGLLDQTPTGLPQFQQRYGAGFGTPSQFAAANTDFRRRGAVMPAYPGYTLLS